MGTVRPRTRANGTVGYTAQIRIARGGINHQEAQTFDREKAALAWIARREEELEKPGALEEATTKGTTLSDTIDKYVRESIAEIGKTKAQVLESIKGFEIAKKEAHTIVSSDLVALGQELFDGGRKPQTVGNYMSHLQAVFAIADAAWGIKLDLAEMQKATKVMKRLGIIARSDQRDVRPTLDQLDKALTYFAGKEELARRRPDSIDMVTVAVFAIFSTRRQDEITRIAWSDLDEEHSRVLVRDMKHPGEKIGNDQWVDLPPEALAIIQAQPRTDGAIFPYDPRSISTNWTNAMKFLGIEDLHFHDLRHDGISRLFEIGWGADGKGTSIPHVAAVSGHRTWTSLKRYTHIRTRGDKYAGWKWLKRIVSRSSSVR